MGYTHGENHGLRNHKLYQIWLAMKQRCYNKNKINYKHYGMRGIEVCNDWLNSFQCFYDFCILNGWKEGLQIDRIDNDGNYEPNNCQLISQAENLGVGKRRKRIDNTSGLVGINYHIIEEKWISRININGIRLMLGYFNTKEEALQARIDAEVLHFGRQITNL
jgi:hypothetical protein